MNTEDRRELLKFLAASLVGICTVGIPLIIAFPEFLWYIIFALICIFVIVVVVYFFFYKPKKGIAHIEWV